MRATRRIGILMLKRLLPPPAAGATEDDTPLSTALGIFRTRLHNIRVGNRIKRGCSLQRTVLLRTNYVFINSRHAN